MTSPVKVEALEAALLARASTLVEEYMARARRSRDRIIEEENERLRLREDRETLAAKAMAERAFRRRVQANELKLQEELDQLRWGLIQSVMDGLPEKLAKLAKDEARYLPVLQQLLAQSAQSVEREELVCEVNAADLKRLKPRWETFARQAVPDRQVSLSSEARPCIGGLLLRSADDRIRVDNTFEGRIERLQDQLQRAIMERLFATAPHMGAIFNG